MGTTDHPAWPDYKATLERLAKAGVRMEAARGMNAPDLDEAEETFRATMDAYEAARECLAEPAPSQFDGVPVFRAWFRSMELAFRASVPRDSDRDTGQT